MLGIYHQKSGQHSGYKMKYFDTEGEPLVGKMIAHGLLLIVGLALLFGSFGNVHAGDRGVKTRFGAIVGVIEPGLYFKWPLIDHVKIIDVHTQSLVATKEAPLSAASHDLQDTKLAVVVNYHIDPRIAGDIYQQYGESEVYYDTIVNPLIVATIKAIASQYTAADQIQKRIEMSSRALDELVRAFDGKNVVIEKADLTDISFSPAFTHAIEAKVTAVQEAEAAKNKLEQVKYEADQRIAEARGEAEAIRIQAQAITQQGGAEYVKLKTIEKWNGQGCTSYCGMDASTGLLISR